MAIVNGNVMGNGMGNGMGNFLLGNNPNNAFNDTILGFSGDDVLAGNSGQNQMFGLAGDDLFLASAGDDVMNGGSGFDTVDYGAIGTVITLRAAGEIDKGPLGSDRVRDVEVVIAASGLNNQIDASTDLASPVFIVVDLVAERLQVGGIPGVADQRFTVQNFVDVFGTSQGDLITGNSLDNVLFGAAGDDWIDGAAGDDFLGGDWGADAVFGGVGDDVLRGGTGSDLLVGEDGSDRLLGYGAGFGSEIDTLLGGAGSDRFILGDESGRYYFESPFNPLLGSQGAGNLDDVYAVIGDWDARADFVQLAGAFGYVAEFRAVGGMGDRNLLDTVISSEGDIIAILQDSTDFNFNRDAIFV